MYDSSAVVLPLPVGMPVFASSPLNRPAMVDDPPDDSVSRMRSSVPFPDPTAFDGIAMIWLEVITAPNAGKDPRNGTTEATRIKDWKNPRRTNGIAFPSGVHF